MSEEIKTETREPAAPAPSTSSTPSPYLVPASIVIAGACIAVALYFSNGAQAIPGAPTAPNEPTAAAPTDAGEVVDPVTDKDHVLGTADAKVTIIEYSDFQCPFCSSLHPTLKRITEEYGDDVRWVYRHFPLESIHPEARPAAVASECVAELGGNDAFWNFADKLFSNQQALSEATYTRLAAEVGVSEAAFTDCLKSDRHNEVIDENTTDAVETGGTGTPHTLIIGEDGTAYPVKGALPYNAIKPIVEQALKG